MVGFRVFDVGLLIVWLVWFFRLRDDDDSTDDDGPGGGGSGPGPRLRDHLTPRKSVRPRGAEPLPHILPARVRQPRAPDPAPRRA